MEILKKNSNESIFILIYRFYNEELIVANRLIIPIVELQQCLFFNIL